MTNNNFFVNWYIKKGRDFPWRMRNVSPFAILITEMLLRQTQALTVSKMWYRFTTKYPDAGSLACASHEELLDQLKILGLGEQRSFALIVASKWLIEHHEGKVPDSIEELLVIPHVGVYAARAVLCFAFNRYIEVVDTNILRLYSRYYDLNVKPDIRRNSEIWEIARNSLPNETKWIQEHNYGLLDFTAEICRAKNPRCNICPLALSCKWQGLQQLVILEKDSKNP